MRQEIRKVEGAGWGTSNSETLDVIRPNGEYFTALDFMEQELVLLGVVIKDTFVDVKK